MGKSSASSDSSSAGSCRSVKTVRVKRRPKTATLRLNDTTAVAGRSDVTRLFSDTPRVRSNKRSPLGAKGIFRLMSNAIGLSSSPPEEIDAASSSSCTSYPDSGSNFDSSSHCYESAVFPSRNEIDATQSQLQVNWSQGDTAVKDPIVRLRTDATALNSFSSKILYPDLTEASNRLEEISTIPMKSLSLEDRPEGLNLLGIPSDVHMRERGAAVVRDVYFKGVFDVELTSVTPFPDALIGYVVHKSLQDTVLPSEIRSIILASLLVAKPISSKVIDTYTQHLKLKCNNQWRCSTAFSKENYALGRSTEGTMLVNGMYLHYKVSLNGSIATQPQPSATNGLMAIQCLYRESNNTTAVLSLLGLEACYDGDISLKANTMSQTNVGDVLWEAIARQSNAPGNNKKDDHGLRSIYR
nr:TPA_asm: hypothetical protein [Triaenorhabdovirus 1]